MTQMLINILKLRPSLVSLLTTPSRLILACVPPYGQVYLSAPVRPSTSKSIPHPSSSLPVSLSFLKICPPLPSQRCPSDLY